MVGGVFGLKLYVRTLSRQYFIEIFSDNYQIIDAFDNPMFALISRIDYVQKNEPRSSGYDPG